MAGFNPSAWATAIEQKKIISGREAWKAFRELCNKKWSEAFLATIEDATGTREFTYLTVVTLLSKRANPRIWEENSHFRDALGGNPIKILTLGEMLDFLWPNLTTTPAASEIGRAIQLIKAANWRSPEPSKKR